MRKQEDKNKYFSKKMSSNGITVSHTQIAQVGDSWRHINAFICFLLHQHGGFFRRILVWKLKNTCSQLSTQQTLGRESEIWEVIFYLFKKRVSSLLRNIHCAFDFDPNWLTWKKARECARFLSDGFLFAGWPTDSDRPISAFRLDISLST